MTPPLIRITPTGVCYALHITYRDRTTQVPAYYDTAGQAEHVASTLQRRFARMPPAATVETDVLFVLDTVRELGGQLQPLKGA